MSDPIARDTLANDLANDQAKGAVVHQFDPNASPEQKAAAVANGAGQLASIVGANKTNGAAAPAVPVATPSAGPPPPITIGEKEIEKANSPNGAAAATTEPTTPSSPKDDIPEPPGALTGPAPPIPDWIRTGWREVTGIDSPALAGIEHERALLNMFISDQYYGQWYHNAAVIFFAVTATYFLTLFRMGWGWLVLVLGACSTYYTNSMKTLRRAVRDDIQRELVKSRLATDHESADWINNFMDRFWLIYEPVLSKSIVSSVDQVLSMSAPPMVESMALTTFTLGTKAPRIERVRTLPRTPDDEVVMDWAISFTSTDLVDIPPSQAVTKTNSKIVLDIKIGKGPARIPFPILVENIEFTGEMRIKLKLMTNFPHVQTVDLSFMSKPNFNYALKPLGGETFGLDINSIPGLQSFIRDTVHSILEPMMYNPNVFTLNLEQLLSGAAIDAATGVLQLKIESARGLKAVKLGGGTPDPYVSISIANRAESARTKFQRSSYNPHFGSVHNLLLNDQNMSEVLTLTVYDHNDRRKDTVLGVATFELSLLAEDATRDGVVAKILREGKECGELIFNVNYYPVLKPKTLEGGIVEPVPETTVGIVRLTIHQAKELDVSNTLSRNLNPLAKVLVNRVVVHQTPTYKHTVAPVWESAAEFIVTDKANTVIGVKVIDDRDILTDPTVGYLSVHLSHILKAKEEQREWFPLANAKSGRIRMTAEWKPLAMAGSVQGAAAYVPPIGVVRLWYELQKAVDVKNVEGTLGGKSDPYVRVMMGGITMARTEVVDNNLNPEWDQIIYVPVHSMNEVLVLETMDYQHMTKDRTLGYVELGVKEIARQNSGSTEYPFESLGKSNRADPIRQQGNLYKGTLHYVAEFIPAYNLAGLTFDARGTELDNTVAGGEESGEEFEVEGGAKYEDIPEGLTIDSPVTANGNGAQNGHKRSGSVDSQADNASVKTSGTKKTGKSTGTAPPATEKAGIEMSREELFKQQSGVLILEAISGDLPRKARLELLLDDGYWPSFSTERSRSTTASWDQVGEGFVKELDFCAIWLRLNENEEGVKDEILGEVRMSALTFLERCWNKEADFELFHKERNERVATVKLLAKYVPVPVQLEARESINNMGSLRVDVISAAGLRAADRGGKSDPYAQFVLNGQKVFKSETIKKTVNPTWNQSFVTLVPSRVAANFVVEVFDWDQVGSSDELGAAKIDLSTLEPMESREVTLPLVSPKYGQKGEIKLGFVFTPQIVARTRKATSTFSVGQRAMTSVAAVPFGAGKGLVHGIAPSLAVPMARTASASNGQPLPELPAGQISQPASVSAATGNSHFPMANTALMSGEAAPPRESGTLRVTVVSAKDLGESNDIKPYIKVKVGAKEWSTKHANKTTNPEWYVDETFSFNVSPESDILTVAVFDHKSLGKDKHLGIAEVEIWRHIQFGRGEPITAADVWVELRHGTGMAQIRLDFEPGLPGNALGPSASQASFPRTGLSSPSRFLTGRKASGAGGLPRREGTPSMDS
ncbi:tricalbin [Clavulina sp. PMI_390]|nr:tricalbin [Clavulina sp. PMI_390]